MLGTGCARRRRRAASRSTMPWYSEPPRMRLLIGTDGAPSRVVTPPTGASQPSAPNMALPSAGHIPTTTPIAIPSIGGVNNAFRAAAATLCARRVTADPLSPGGRTTALPLPPPPLGCCARDATSACMMGTPAPQNTAFHSSTYRKMSTTARSYAVTSLRSCGAFTSPANTSSGTEAPLLKVAASVKVAAKWRSMATRRGSTTPPTR